LKLRCGVQPNGTGKGFRKERREKTDQNHFAGMGPGPCSTLNHPQSEKWFKRGRQNEDWNWNSR